mgnify:CR=1 FL=1
MNAILASKCVLVLVDYQQKLMPAIYRGEQVIAEAVRLAETAREFGLSLLFIHHQPGLSRIGTGCDACRAGGDDALLAPSAAHAGSPRTPSGSDERDQSVADFGEGGLRVIGSRTVGQQRRQVAEKARMGNLRG